MPETLQEWKEFARRDDCLDTMVPSDLRVALAKAEYAGTMKHRGQGMAVAAAICMRNWSNDQIALDILGAAGYDSIADLERDEVDEYDLEPLRKLFTEEYD